MGLFSDTKSAVPVAAAEAWAEGALFFAPLLNSAAGTGVGPDVRVKAWDAVLADVVRIGWKLHTWTVVAGAGNRLQAVPLFVR